MHINIHGQRNSRLRWRQYDNQHPPLPSASLPDGNDFIIKPPIHQPREYRSPFFSIKNNYCTRGLKTQTGHSQRPTTAPGRPELFPFRSHLAAARHDFSWIWVADNSLVSAVEFFHQRDNSHQILFWSADAKTRPFSKKISRASINKSIGRLVRLLRSVCLFHESADVQLRFSFHC